MNSTKQTSVIPALQVHDLTRIAMGAASITICSWIAIPTAIPFTLQTLGVFLTVGLLGGRQGTLAVLAYLLLGAVGLPVLGGFTGGLGIMLGFTGGYLLGFLASALVMWAMGAVWGRQGPVLAVSMLAGLLICYVCGVGWYMLFYAPSTGLSLTAAVGYQVIPFLIPDLAKIALALALVARLRRHVR